MIPARFFASKCGTRLLCSSFFGLLITVSVINELNAQDMQLIRPLSFGTVVILNNNSPGTITIDEIGNVSFSDNFIFIEPPEYGIIQLSGFPPNAQMTVSPIILNSQFSSTPVSPETFTFDAINTVNTININSDGTEELRVGGEISISGSTSNNFANADYSAGLSITVNY